MTQGGSPHRRAKEVRKLLMELDKHPKQVHTFTVERSVPVVMSSSGAVQIKAKGDHWIMYPTSADEVPLTNEECESAIEEWQATLKQVHEEAREAADANDGSTPLQQLWVDIEEDDEWRPYDSLPPCTPSFFL